jgi:hypothetical protein
MCLGIAKRVIALSASALFIVRIIWMLASRGLVNRGVTVSPWRLTSVGLKKPAQLRGLSFVKWYEVLIKFGDVFGRLLVDHVLGNQFLIIV